MISNEGILLRILSQLDQSTSAVLASITVGTEGHLGFEKNSEGSRAEESSMPSGTSY